MIEWLTVRFGAAAVRYLIIGLAVAALLAAVFMLGRCGRPDAARQAEQTTRSGEAASQAATVAIDVLEGRVATEDEIDRAIAVGQMEIANATDYDAVRRAVLDGVCGKAEYRFDPACQK